MPRDPARASIAGSMPDTWRRLRFSMKHRYLVALLGVAVIAFSVPMYRLIRQDYLPTNVDDGQFEVRAVAPEGMSLAAMDDLMQTVERQDSVRRPE